MSLPPGRHCYTRPNRTTPRRFTCRDVYRIAGYAAATNSRKCVARAALDATGYTKGLCNVLSLIRKMDEFEDKTDMAKVLSAIGTIIAGISKILKGAGKMNKALGALLVVLGSVGASIQVMVGLLDEIDLIDDLIDLQEMVCGDTNDG